MKSWSQEDSTSRPKKVTSDVCSPLRNEARRDRRLTPPLLLLNDDGSITTEEEQDGGPPSSPPPPPLSSPPSASKKLTREARKKVEAAAAAGLGNNSPLLGWSSSFGEGRRGSGCRLRGLRGELRTPTASRAATEGSAERPVRTS